VAKKRATEMSKSQDKLKGKQKIKICMPQNKIFKNLQDKF
jgi:hypothetical protein